MKTTGRVLTLLALALPGAGLPVLAGEPAADVVYRGGHVYTADRHDTEAESIALRDGRVLAVGTDAAVASFIGPQTTVVALRGRFVMPGLVDAHMHPFSAGQQLTKCNLNYATQTVPQLQAAIQACLDATRAREPDQWLEVVNWNREVMLPEGVTTSAVTLDTLNTRRPIIVLSSQGHSGLANTRALKLADLTAATPDPVGGRIVRDASGRPTGLLDEAPAFDLVTKLLPTPTAAEDVAAAGAAAAALNRQGVTTCLDAWATEAGMAAFAALEKAGHLTVRANFAPPINPNEAGAIDAAVARIVGFRRTYDEGALKPAPGITVRNAKLFLDGVIYAPAFTGAMVEPYFRNAGTEAKPRWVPGTNRGPAVYFPPPVLAEALVALGREGIDPHLHADGDGAVRAALDAIAAMRKALPGADIRPAIAHDEIVTPADFPRFKALNVTAALGFQWAQPAGYTLGLTRYFGPARMKILEPAGLLARAGARLSLGSDWPVDPLDEWFAFKVAVTRTGPDDAAPAFRGRLGDDPGLQARSVLRAATIDAAYQLHADDVLGSLEAGKFADLIILDRNPLTIPGPELARVRVLETVVGGRVVYRADDAAPP